MSNPITKTCPNEGCRATVTLSITQCLKCGTKC